MNNIDFEVLKKAREFYFNKWIDSKNVSIQTKKAQKITKEWQNSLLIKGYKKEVKISASSNDKIDLLNEIGDIAYEFKVSGKNISHEFFKDIYKILTYNIYSQGSEISDFVFISEPKSIINMEKRLDVKFLSLIREKHNLRIYLLPLYLENSISSLMMDPPEIWGLRGDPYLWLDLFRKFSIIEIPESKKLLKSIFTDGFYEFVGDDKKVIYYNDKYNYGGMSGGKICKEFWIDKYIPSIIEKFERRKHDR